MSRSLFLLCTGLLVLHNTAFGQEQGQAGSLTALQNEVAALKTSLADINRKLDALTTAQNNAALDAVAPMPNGQDRLRNIEQRVAALENDVADQGNMLRTVTEKTESGDVYVRFDTNSQAARRELDRAMKSTVPEHAEFIIRNRTNRDASIYVNGDWYTVRAQNRRRLEVPPGTVTTGMRNQQRFTLHVGFPNYSHTIDIRERPVSWAVQPVYTIPVGWVAATY